MRAIQSLLTGSCALPVGRSFEIMLHLLCTGEVEFSLFSPDSSFPYGRVRYRDCNLLNCIFAIACHPDSSAELDAGLDGCSIIGGDLD